jgi:hypothetical protein
MVDYGVCGGELVAFFAMGVSGFDVIGSIRRALCVFSLGARVKVSWVNAELDPAKMVEG